MDTLKKTEAEQIDFYKRCHEKFSQAASLSKSIKYYYNIGGMRVCLWFAGETLVSVFTGALAHLRIPPVKTPDATICLWDSETTTVKMVPPPCEWSDFTDRGDIWGFNSKRIKTAFHWGEFSVNVMDLKTNTGVYWVETRKKIPYWVYASPLRTMFHWLMENNGCQLLHAAAVGTEHGAVLISGKGGTGKSTTALNCLKNDFFYLGDDYVIVRAEPKPMVYSLYSTAKVNADAINKHPFFIPLAQKQKSKEQEKIVISLYPHFKEKIVHEMPLKYLLTPEIKNIPKACCANVSLWTLKRAMAFTTMSQLPHAGKQTHDFINQLCEAVPGYTLELGDDISYTPLFIAGLLSNKQKLPKKSHTETLNKKPLVSVIVPVYNGEAFIREAINNILSQKYPSLEIIIINDGSTDKSEEIINTLDIDMRYFRQENSGPSAARNKGIKDATGEYIAFLDVDDLWPENNLNLLVDILNNNPDLLVVHGYAQLLEKDKDSGTYDYAGNPKESFPGYIGAGLYRKEAFSIVGLYDEFMKFGEDADWFKRAGELNIKMKKLEEVTLYVRRHENNMTKGKNLVELNALKVFKKSLDRTRNPKAKPEISARPKISTIIPVYNAEKYIHEAVYSIWRQTIKPIEVIIVDDGSTDNSVSEIEKLGQRVKLIQQENKGAATARNLAIKESQGEFLAFLDADDLWTSEHIEDLHRPFEEDSQLDMVVGLVEQFVCPELTNKKLHNIDDSNRIHKGFHPGAMLVRKKAFLSVGMLNENLQLGEFVDWFSKAEDIGLKTKTINKVVYKRRLHETNQGVLKKDHSKDYLKVMKEAISRKRNT